MLSCLHLIFMRSQNLTYGSCGVFGAFSICLNCVSYNYRSKKSEKNQQKSCKIILVNTYILTFFQYCQNSVEENSQKISLNVLCFALGFFCFSLNHNRGKSVILYQYNYYFIKIQCRTVFAHYNELNNIQNVTTQTMRKLPT